MFRPYAALYILFVVTQVWEYFADDVRSSGRQLIWWDTFALRRAMRLLMAMLACKCPKFPDYHGAAPCSQSVDTAAVNRWDLNLPRDHFCLVACVWEAGRFNEDVLFSLHRAAGQRTNREDRLDLTVPGNVIRISQFSVGTILSQDLRDIM